MFARQKLGIEFLAHHLDPALRDAWIYKDEPQKPEVEKYKSESQITEEDLARAGEAPEGNKKESLLDRVNRLRIADADMVYRYKYDAWKKKLVDEISSGRVVVGGTCIGVAIATRLPVNIDLEQER